MSNDDEDPVITCAGRSFAEPRLYMWPCARCGRECCPDCSHDGSHCVDCEHEIFAGEDED